jgi:hypothetical protein
MPEIAKELRSKAVRGKQTLYMTSTMLKYDEQMLKMEHGLTANRFAVLPRACS